MTVTYVGSLSIGGAVPAAASAAASGVAGINAALPDIQARLAALATFSPQPVSFAASLAVANQVVTSLQAAIATGIPAPDISAQIATVTALIAALEAIVSGVDAELSAITTFQGVLSAAGLHVYAFAGAVNALGGELATELTSGLPGGGPTDAANALVLITTTPATWAAVQQVFRVTP